MANAPRKSTTPRGSLFSCGGGFSFGFGAGEGGVALMAAVVVLLEVLAEEETAAADARLVNSFDVILRDVHSQ